MSKSGRLRLSDVRQAYRLTHECRDLGHDPAAWPRHAIEQLARFVGARVGVAALGVTSEPGPGPGELPKHTFVGEVA